MTVRIGLVAGPSSGKSTTIDATIDVSKSLNYYAAGKTTSDTLCSKM